jgi:hypothetical protein
MQYSLERVRKLTRQAPIIGAIFGVILCIFAHIQGITGQEHFFSVFLKWQMLIVLPSAFLTQFFFKKAIGTDEDLRIHNPEHILLLDVALKNRKKRKYAIAYQYFQLLVRLCLGYFFVSPLILMFNFFVV